ncbi:unnamed protein product [Fusarium graminearum]|uniref:Uncharacterized protein n=1 Tax=Gibberella zeae TaxID=5518 RepID=A0A2H3GCD1_GIBZA|nr:hypothetical protein HG531_000070 [Fusarium graminearum]PCD28435.1 hypothetical protein FGRA07_03574 [Fusarium graminearum]CAG1998325.1 unnamed protein product [Fusarium graminearum]CAG2006401.1 unnamed protein product [Fusarium graminearum]
MPKVPAASTWAGAPLVAEDGFAFAEGVFFAQASGQNRHRRATATELKEHFSSSNDKDHPAHWFEAQLIHYGLQPSKTKSTKLKKEWTKNDREAKKGATNSKPAAKPPVAKAETKATAGTKRKATDNDNAPAVKKTKTTTAKATAPARKIANPKAKAKAPPKMPAKVTAKTTTKAPSKAVTESTTPAKPRLKQTARRGGSSQGPGRNASASEPARPPRTKQTARQAGAFAGRGRIPVPPSGNFDAPPPYSEFPDQAYFSDGHSPSNSYRSYDSDPDDGGSLEPLGLLNGDYEITWSDVTEQWDHYDPDNFELCLTLEGNRLWGQFNLGVYEGVLRFNERPMRSSHDRLEFTWRGREDMGPVIYGNSNKGWMEFLGDGRIIGCVDGGQTLSFRAQRIEDQGTRSRTDADSMQDEWSSYTYHLYEQENRARW